MYKLAEVLIAHHKHSKRLIKGEQVGFTNIHFH